MPSFKFATNTLVPTSHSSLIFQVKRLDFFFGKGGWSLGAWCLVWESYETHTYTVWAKCRVSSRYRRWHIQVPLHMLSHRQGKPGCRYCSRRILTVKFRIPSKNSSSVICYADSHKRGGVPSRVSVSPANYYTIHHPNSCIIRVWNNRPI